ncbi:MAG: ribosome assembly RNA-binding protein YhbY [Wenzhouxiangella sp.]|jgi:RNA-binding protein|nr:ribosome assembly RNA-binding protein YhbY [Wenzhouxiangella sp.]
MNLSNSQRKFLRGLTHDLEPVVMVADKGLSDNVRAEIEQALAHHELIKVKLRADREQRNSWVAEITAETRSELIHQIGQVACFYRRHPKKPKINLPR